MSSHSGYIRAEVRGYLERHVCRCNADTTASHLSERASQGISHQGFLGGYHSCIFSFFVSLSFQVVHATHCIRGYQGSVFLCTEASGASS